MGGEPYCYFTTYNADIQKALDDLRENELAAGRYEPCFHGKVGKYLFELGFEPRHKYPAPGGCHASIDVVFENMDADGTNSILDITRAVTKPFPKVEDPFMSSDIIERLNTSAPLADGDIREIFGTDRPSADQIESILLATGSGGDVDMKALEKRDIFWGEVNRGQSRYVVAYRNGKPDQIFFAGMSFD